MNCQDKSALSKNWPHGHVEVQRGNRPVVRQQGVALVVVLIMVAIMTIFLAELMQNTSTALHIAVGQRDKLKAEYLAKSGLNLTRLLIAKEPQLRRAVTPLYSMAFGRRPPQMNVWDFADAILKPFSDFNGSKELAQGGGIDFGQMEGLTDTGGSFSIVGMPENSMININNPLGLGGIKARTSLAMQFYALMGGYQSPDSPYDLMFSSEDADGAFTNRLDVVSAAIDWWDYDETRSNFDPGASTITTAGSEDDFYSQLRDPYDVKNAPYDSVEEIRLLRGVGDDFWATFIQSDPEDPRSRMVTIYGYGSVNVNMAPPEVLLARLCSFLITQPLCQDPVQMAAFITMFKTARAIIPVALFTTTRDFLNFVEGKGGPKDPYPMLISLLGEDNLFMMWTPVVINASQRKDITSAFLTQAKIFTIQSTAQVGRARVRHSAVINFHGRWTPPQPNAGTMPGLGIFHHFRVD